MGKITYERPPLIEVSFGLHFSPLVGFRAAHYGIFWSRLRPDFTETLDKPVVGQIAIGASAEEWFPLPRVWFVHKEQEQLLQLQPNRFYFNWRRALSGGAYPRFEALEPAFHSYVNKLGQFVASEALGSLEVTGFELAYVNHIFKGEGWDTIGDVGKVFPDLGWRSRSDASSQPKGLAWHAVFEQTDMRLDVDVKTGTTTGSPSRQVLIFELRATRMSSASLSELSEWLTRANSQIVSKFEDLTDRRMQIEVWKRAGS
jgi:uncharacterized protein (TIGR04255 family)